MSEGMLGNRERWEGMLRGMLGNRRDVLRDE
jgi:hypothetical protein